MIIGIDNGLSGGMAAISRAHGLLIDSSVMPSITRVHTFRQERKRKVKGKIIKTNDFAKSNEIDGNKVTAWIKAVTHGNPCTIVIEACPEHADTVGTMRSMATSYGILIGAIASALPAYSLVIVRSGNAKDSWQRAMLPTWQKGETKELALARARELWPDETWLPTPRHSTPHTGIIDAALIAEHIRRRVLF